MALRINHGKRAETAADFLAQSIVNIPAPIRRKDDVTHFRIIGNGNMDGPGTACRSDGIGVAFGATVFKGFLDGP